MVTMLPRFRTLLSVLIISSAVLGSVAPLYATEVPECAAERAAMDAAARVNAERLYERRLAMIAWMDNEINIDQVDARIIELNRRIINSIDVQNSRTSLEAINLFRPDLITARSTLGVAYKSAIIAANASMDAAVAATRAYDLCRRS